MAQTGPYETLRHLTFILFLAIAAAVLSQRLLSER